jgi:hypothetical protein
MGGACSIHGGERNLYKILVGKPEGKRLIKRPRCRGDDSIKIDVMVIGFRGMDWIHVAQDRDQWQAVVNIIINLPVL